ncbi:ArnT family glycosyltransferase [Solicola sp. PLA-1-18]|uniref:ArnT family glycosyltransferase n=1 Tax=Solicola sp. PLA-1-18 TaxID=3380532 RepID=UPI003B764DC7
MTDLLTRPATGDATPEPTGPRRPSRLRRAPHALRAWAGRHRKELYWLVPLTVLGVLVQAVGMYGAPQRIDDEGTYVAQAWAVLNLGELAHYTYWYDHPPLGWLQLAGFAALTGGFGRGASAIEVGRDFTLVAQMISIILLWTLARRLRMPRWAAGLAVAIFALSPLAVQFHRAVYLDNVATPWILAAFVLALSPRKNLGAAAAAGVCFGIACLTKETSLLLLPPLAWLMWRNAHVSTRRYTVAVAASLFTLVGVFYMIFAAIRGELFPGPDHTSLWDGVMFQLGGRDTSGNPFSDGTLGNRTLDIWMQLDPVLPVVSVVAAVGALLVKRIRPLAVGYLLLLVMILRPGGYLPVPYAILLLPFAALLVAGVVHAAWRARPQRVDRRVTRSATAVVGTALVVVSAMFWGPQLRGLWLAPLDAPMADATSWIETNVPTDQRILTDDALWVDLVSEGRDRNDVVWYYKPDTDSAVQSGWQGYDYVVSTDSVRADPEAFPTLDGALKNSVPVASFGSGTQLVEVRRVQAGANDADALTASAEARATAGAALARNPSIELSDQARQQLQDGRVSGGLVAILATVAQRGPIGIDAFVSQPGEDAANQPLRSAELVDADGTPLDGDRATAIETLVAGQPAPFDASVDRSGSGSVELIAPMPR